MKGFNFEVPPGYLAKTNPWYADQTLFEDQWRTQEIDPALGVKGIWSALKAGGAIKCRLLLFDESKWATEEAIDEWVEAKRPRLKFATADGSGPIWAHKTFEVKVDKAYGPRPTEEDLAAINAFALTTLTADQVYARQMDLCTTLVDRRFERFDHAMLRQFRDTIIGKSFLVGHDYSKAPKGRFFGATSVQRHRKSTGAPYRALQTQVYLPICEATEEARAMIDAGVWKDVSIGFYAENLNCDLCGGDYRDLGACQHLAGQVYGMDEVADGMDADTLTLTEDGKGVVATALWNGRGEAAEGSAVWQGCQYEAEFTKALHGDLHEAKAIALGLRTTRSWQVPAAHTEGQSAADGLIPGESSASEEPEAEVPGNDTEAKNEVETMTDEEKALLESVQARVKELEGEQVVSQQDRAKAEEAYRVFHKDVASEVERLAGVLKEDTTLAALKAAWGEDLGQAPPDKLLALKADWTKAVAESLPPQRQSTAPAEGPANLNGEAEMKAPVDLL